MTNPKRIIFAALVTSLLATMSFSCRITGNQAKAESIPIDTSETSIDNMEEITTRGLYTSLSLSINGGNGKVWATVKNDITIFPATVYVIVELYSSTVYQEKHEDMTLVAINSTMDLNMGKTIVAEASTGGVQQYWQARMRYKIDNKAWEAKDTGTMLYSAEGKFIGIL